MRPKPLRIRVCVASAQVEVGLYPLTCAVRVREEQEADVPSAEDARRSEKIGHFEASIEFVARRNMHSSFRHDHFWILGCHQWEDS
jgi:hypothetical protein